MSRTHPRAFLVRLVAAAGVVTLSGCTGSWSIDAEPSPEQPAPPAVTDPAVIADVEGQTEDVAPAPDPAVVLTYAGYDESDHVVTATAFLAGVVEEGGRCVLVVQQDDEVVEAEFDAMPSATTTDCGNLRAELPADAAGEWEAAVTYASAAHEQISRTVAVEIP